MEANVTEEDAKLQEFREKLSSNALRDRMDIHDCRRFLRARKWDVHQALEMVGF